MLTRSSSRTTMALGLAGPALALALLGQPASARAQEATTEYGPPKGTLLIVGGGSLKDSGIPEKFIELAGGKDARIVVVPTAGGNKNKDGSIKVYTEDEVLKSWRARGLTHVTMLHTADPKIADTPAFVKPLTEANAVWFEGGRQWNIVDSYANTLTYKEFHRVLERGGVIGGSSAGATIQGDFLVRGAIEGSNVMVAPEPEHHQAFAFLRKSAIDQHINTRNRWDDLDPLIKDHPDLLGIGLSENTAIIVHGDRFEVIGAWKVAVHDNTRVYQPGEKPYYLLSAGDVYNMKTRRIEKVGTAHPDTVFFEDLTSDELRETIKNGATNVIIATGGAEDAGPGLVAGVRTDVATYTAERIARAVGHTLVAPVIAYAPGGLLPVPRDKGYEQLLEAAAESARGSGFKNVFFLGEAAASQDVLKAVAERLDTAWKANGVRVFSVSSRASGPVDASEALAINAQRVRLDKLPAARPGAAGPGPQQGVALLAKKVDAAVAQIRTLLGQSGSAAAVPAAALVPPGPRVLPTPDPRRSAGPSLFLEDLTAAEIHDAIARGSTVVILPTGGTEKNGFHMAMGKHNFHARAASELMAKKLGNALIAPVLQYVPEAAATETTPGVLSCGRGCFEPVVASIARSLKALGFTEILLVGDNGGNQSGLTAAATELNGEWEGSGTKAYALTDFYDKGHEYQDAWFLAQFGWDAATVGSHAGIKDTSQMLYVKPEDVRIDRIVDSFTNRRESGVSGDPTKATAEFGRIGLEFKANGAIAQYRALKAQAGGGGGRGGRRGSTRSTAESR